MKIAFPSTKDKGLDSAVFNHFGSAPMFIVVDSDTLATSVITNGDMHHAHGACSPMKALSGVRVDAIVVGGIGGGAINGLQRLGIRVYKATGKTVRENFELLQQNALSEMSALHACQGHGNAGGCAH